MSMMGLFKGSLPSCPTNSNCAQWARIYMKLCLCSVKDGVSFSFGLASVISWGVAEVPQLITNFKEKSTAGLSLAFLITWIVGDLFNLFGCMLEPATLTTQYYMAMLYTATTLMLTGQTIYYGHIYHRLKANKIDKGSMIENKQTSGTNDDKQFKGQGNWTNGTNITAPGLHLSSSPIPVTATLLPRLSSQGGDLYYMSARSLTMSRAPTAGSYPPHSRDSGRTLHIPIANHSPIEEPLLNTVGATQSAPSLNTKSMLCVVSVMTFFLSGFGLHHSMDDRFNSFLRKPKQGVVFQVARRVLQSKSGSSFISEGDGSSGIGSYLGWAMAAIYMGGRLPQICLNIRRGNVEGLNPLMFIFALVGNITYVASILVSSMDWSKIRPNLPWLVDAGGCVLLDSFILLQFIYFCCWKQQRSKSTCD